MHIDPELSAAGLGVGLVVGLTGMGGGALMTPLLVLLFGTSPSAAVSSDLVTSLVMKPVGGAVHLRHGTVHRGIVLHLLVGAVPAAFCGVFLLHALGSGDSAQARIELALGAALLLAVAGMMTRIAFPSRSSGEAAFDDRTIPVRPAATVVLGALGGVIVGMTSVGSGSVIVVVLMWLYPRLSLRSLVGTDLVQAVPLVGSAAVSHMIFGDVKLALTVSLLIGAIPGVYVGARWSARGATSWLRPLLAGVLLASGLKLLDAPAWAVAVAAVVLGVAAALLARRPLRPAKDIPEPEPIAVESARSAGGE